MTSPIDTIFGNNTTAIQFTSPSYSGTRPSLESIFGSTSSSLDNRPSLDSIFNAPPLSPVKPNLMDNILKPLGEKLATGEVNTAKALYERGKNLFSSASEADLANKPMPERILGSISNAAKKGIETIAGGVGDIFTHMVSPLIPQKVKDVYKESFTKFLSDSKDALTAPVTTPEEQKGKDQLMNFVSSIVKVSKDNPQATQIVKDALGDAFNIFGLGAGGKVETAIKIATEQGVKTGANIIEKTAPIIKEGIQEIKETAGVSFTGEKGTINTLIRESGQMAPEKSISSAWKDIRPKSTAGNDLSYAKQGNVTEQGLFKRGEATPSPADNKLLDVQSKLYENGTLKNTMSPNEKQGVINQRANQLNQNQKEFLAKNDKAVNLITRDKIGLFDKLNSVAKESSMPFSKDITAKGAYDSAIDTFKSYLKTGKSAGTIKEATTLSKIDIALTKFDRAMKKFGAWEKSKTGELSDSAKARIQAIRDIHTTARDFISDNLPTNSPWKAIRSEESTLYDISNRLAQRIQETMQNGKITQTIKQFPIIKDIIRSVGLGTGLNIFY